jgi:UDP-N-acetyl-D-glucosamine/UDP-N-acetyl-D-galactosamine dehydrogenase
MHTRTVSVIGLGYVGLPAAVAFATQGRVIGFDINSRRIAELNEGIDVTRETNPTQLKNPNLLLTDKPEYLRQADFHIIAVPTPVDADKQPDLSPVLKASKTVGNYLKPGDIVVYESTVYPGATEERCVPVLERQSGLQCGLDFTVGYSPERINPGDTQHGFTQVVKVVSGQDAATLEIVAAVYASVITAGVHRAPSIRVAEAAKVIENIQRDVNIALINELAMIFARLGLDTHDVLAASRTKWNFLPFTPGLVGGHCIGVDPYYLAHKAQQVGYQPAIIPAARLLNENMGVFVAQQVLQQFARLGCLPEESIVSVLGLAFKENVSDLRNTRVVDIVRHLLSAGVNVQVHDPLVNVQQARQEHDIVLHSEERLQKAHCIILAVPHRYYLERGWPWLQSLLKDGGRTLVVDVKGVLVRESCPDHVELWRL